MKDILKELNEEQVLPVKCTEGPVMVIAGAGSGKTRVLTYRIAHLINNGVDPFKILSLTFTNKAAREMKERIVKLVGGHEAKNVWMGTFHSIFARILRIESERLNYPRNFTIYDTDDSKSLIKKIIKEQNLDDKIYKAAVVLNSISKAKSNLISVAEYKSNQEIQEFDKANKRPLMGDIYAIYKTKCKKASAMDFDDLLFNTNVLLRDFPDVLHKYQHKFSHILVDEYQDTNFAQYLIVKKLAANNENICVVGDDAQSIYAFRGANIENIFNFRRDYPDFKLFKLEQNYRSTKVIVNAANSIISNNQDQIKKEVWTENANGNKIKIFKTATDNEEGKIVASTIFELKMNNQLSNDAFCILYRTNAQSRALEEALRKSNIPYRIYGGLSFYKRKEIKDMLAYFRLTINPNDEEALLRVINYPQRGIGKTTLEKIIIEGNNTGKTLLDVISNLGNTSLSLNSGTMKKISEFALMIQSFGALNAIKNAYDLAKHIAESSGLVRSLYDDKSPEGVSRYENIEELLNGIKEFSDNEIEDNTDTEGEQKTMHTLDEYLQDIALLTDMDTDDKDDTDRVALMTIHSAKGLEFPYVFIAGMEENLFPSMLSLHSRQDLEEERRLFYVALTRAEEQLFISYSETRYKWGNITFCEPSRFIDEIDKRFIDEHDIETVSPPQKSFSEERKSYTRKTNTDYSQRTTKSISKKSSTPAFTPPKNLKSVASSKPSLSSAAASAISSDLTIGTTIEHERFGKGKIVNMEGRDANIKATILFDTAGQKQLLLRFAKLKIIK